MNKIGHILVPVDYSAGSHAALEHAVSLAREFKAQVDVLHVWEPPVTVNAYAGAWPHSLLAEAIARRRLDQVIQPLRTSGVEVDGWIDSGDPADVILRNSQRGYDLIVMGTRGRTGLAHLLLGSVAESVVRRATCPVLTIRVPDEQRSQPSA